MELVNFFDRVWVPILGRVGIASILRTLESPKKENHGEWYPSADSHRRPQGFRSERRETGKIRRKSMGEK